MIVRSTRPLAAGVAQQERALRRSTGLLSPIARTSAPWSASATLTRLVRLGLPRATSLGHDHRVLKRLPYLSSRLFAALWRRPLVRSRHIDLSFAALPRKVCQVLTSQQDRARVIDDLED